MHSPALFRQGVDIGHGHQRRLVTLPADGLDADVDRQAAMVGAAPAVEPDVHAAAALQDASPALHDRVAPGQRWPSRMNADDISILAPGVVHRGEITVAEGLVERGLARFRAGEPGRG